MKYELCKMSGVFRSTPLKTDPYPNLENQNFWELEILKAPIKFPAKKYLGSRLLPF